MARFGPTIWTELEAAGLGGQPISIAGDDIEVGARLPDHLRPVLEAVLRDHDPTKPAVVPKGPVENAIQALIDEGIIPPGKVQALLNRVKGR